MQLVRVAVSERVCTARTAPSVAVTGTGTVTISRLNAGSHAGNHIYEDFLDWMEFGGVDERVDADGAKCNEHCRVIAAIN